MKINSVKPIRKRSLLTGVIWSSACQKWASHIKYDGKQFHLGIFDNEIDATCAYITKKIELNENPFDAIENLKEVTGLDYHTLTIYYQKEKSK